jgi:hypothetical protein
LDLVLDFFFPGSVNSPNSLINRRVRGEGGIQCEREKHVTRFCGVRIFYHGPLGVSTDLLQRTSNPLRKPGELNSGRISQELALATDGGLDEGSCKTAEAATKVQDATDKHETGGRGSSLLLSTATGPATNAKEDISHRTEQGYPREYPDES